MSSNDANRLKLILIIFVLCGVFVLGLYGIHSPFLEVRYGINEYAWHNDSQIVVCARTRFGTEHDFLIDIESSDIHESGDCTAYDYSKMSSPDGSKCWWQEKIVTVPHNEM